MEMIPVSEAKRLVKNLTCRTAPVRVPIPKSLGLTLSNDVTSPVDIPSFPQSSMDGYAFSHSSLSNHASLKVIGTVSAGSNQTPVVRVGQAVRIFTGAPLPEGTDTVVMQEKCTRTEDVVTLLQLPAKGENVRQPGTEAAKGTLALAAGQTMTPAGIGFLSGLGLTDVEVHPMPSVSILVTGDELVEPGTTRRFGQVFESNSRSLTAALEQMGVFRIRKAACRDDLGALSTALAAELEASELVLLTGGVSVGDRDHVLPATRECGVEQVFHRVRQKPGKPLFFGTRDGKPVFGLPGNPASVLTCFYEYVTPAIDLLSSRRDTLKVCMATLEETVRKPAGLTHFLKAVHADGRVKVLDGQESYKLNAFSRANCLVVLDEESTLCESGERVETHLLPSH